MLRYLQRFNFTSLFIELGWNYPNSKGLKLTIGKHQQFILEAIAEKHGMIVYRCDSDDLPSIAMRCKIDKVVTEYSFEHLIIYTDSDRTNQIWQWVKRTSDQEVYREYLLQSKNHQYCHDLLGKLSQLSFDLIEESSLTLFKVVKRVRQAFDSSNDISSFVYFKEFKTYNPVSFELAKKLIKQIIPYRLVSIDNEFEFIPQIAEILAFDQDVQFHFADILKLDLQTFSWREFADFLRKNSDNLLKSLECVDREELRSRHGVDRNDYPTFEETLLIFSSKEFLQILGHNAAIKYSRSIGIQQAL